VLDSLLSIESQQNKNIDFEVEGEKWNKGLRNDRNLKIYGFCGHEKFVDLEGAGEF